VSPFSILHARLASRPASATILFGLPAQTRGAIAFIQSHNILFYSFERKARQGESQEGKTKRGREVKSRRNKNKNIKSKSKKRHCDEPGKIIKGNLRDRLSN